jgi:hypothetical protein
MPPAIAWSREAAAYSAAREALLSRILEQLTPDERFVAGWLGGSYGRGTQDAVSDLDLTLVVRDDQRDALCARPWMVAEGTTARRLAVLQQFGDPVIIHENHHNAPEAGSFTFVLYARSALVVDWIFVPQSNALRPPDSRLLFEKEAIPLQRSPPDNAPQRIAAASERVSFFWMMAAVTAKARARGQGVRFCALLDLLHQVAAEVARLVAGEPVARISAQVGGPPADARSQAEALRQVCGQMVELMPQVARLGGHVPLSPMTEIEALLSLA